jgi:site-specific DNA-cytosine methylase
MYPYPSPTRLTGTKLRATSILQITVVELLEKSRTRSLKLNFRSSSNQVDISTLTAGYLASLKATLWLLSPACQPYTVLNPSAKGELDPRAKSFLHLVQNIIPELAREDAHPTHFLVENVGGFEVSRLWRSILRVIKTA